MSSAPRRSATSWPSTDTGVDIGFADFDGDGAIEAVAMARIPNDEGEEGEEEEEDEEALALRILPDRSVVDFFVQGGRFAGTQSWLSGTPRTIRFAVGSTDSAMISPSPMISADWAVRGAPHLKHAGRREKFCV